MMVVVVVPVVVLFVSIICEPRSVAASDLSPGGRLVDTPNDHINAQH